MRSVLIAVTAAGVLAPPAQAALAPVAPPTVTGTPEYAATLVASPGTWTPAATAYSYQWLRDGQPVAGATAASYEIGLDDLDHTLAVTVTATDGVDSGTATSAPTAAVRRATMTASRQRVLGEARYTHRLRARPGRFSAPDAVVRYEWPDGSTGRGYEIRPQDVGSRVTLRVTARAPGHEPLTVEVRSAVVRHRVDARRTVRYHVETRGHLTTGLEQFRTQAQQTFDDPRGWRSAGIRFVPVRRGGAFTLVLSAAAYLPRFSSGCSAMWSCRVGRYVIINQERWKHASPAWNAAGLALRDYRHMVVNHETGHWLGRGHVGCTAGRGPAPVMMQQSKGTGGCSFNPWPLPGEL